MIDIEPVLYNSVANQLYSAFGVEILVSDTYTEAPSKFPFVSVVEVDNAIYSPSVTLDRIENHARVSYQIDIFTNNPGTKKINSKTIAKVVDSIMVGMGFRRASSMQTPNIDRKIYRYTLRYDGIACYSEDGEKIIIYN